MQGRRAHAHDQGHGVRGARRLGVLLACAGALLVMPAPSAYALTVAPGSIAAVEGSPFSGPVASFTDLGTPVCPPQAGYAASIDWGGGITSTGTVGPAPGGGPVCTYPVSAAHTFDDEGARPVTVTITGPGPAQRSAASPATVSDAVITAVGMPVNAIAGTPFRGIVATFNDGDPTAAPATYTATIAWGDGTTTPDPTIAANPAGGFTVSGGHAYQQPGSFAMTVTVADDGGSTASAGATAVAAAAPPGVPPPPAVTQPALATPPMIGVSAPRLAGPTQLSLRLACPASAPHCRGVARVITLPARAKKSPLRGGTPLGSTLFVLTAGQARTVSITVPKRLRQILHHSHSARLAGVAITFAGGRNAAVTGPTAVVATAGLH